MAEQETVEEPGNKIHYPEDLIEWCELDWGEGFLSPGGGEEVAKIVEGLDLAAKQVLDIGIGLAGPSCYLVKEHGAAHVMGIDVEDTVLNRAKQIIEAQDLQNRITLKKVRPGPLPFDDNSFDIVFSKDAIIHIPDTQELFNEIYRVLKPGGWFTISDWYCDETPFTDEMKDWVQRYELDLAMKPIETDSKRCESAGFTEITALDRNKWYHRFCCNQLEQLRGPRYKSYVEALGEEGTKSGIEAAEVQVTLTSQGQIRPGHIRGRKPLHAT
jgi:ubiquinone/menaquinone biosynthesis C-methylase UbiE